MSQSPSSSSPAISPMLQAILDHCTPQVRDLYKTQVQPNLALFDLDIDTFLAANKEYQRRREYEDCRKNTEKLMEAGATPTEIAAAKQQEGQAQTSLADAQTATSTAKAVFDDKHKEMGSPPLPWIRYEQGIDVGLGEEEEEGEARTDLALLTAPITAPATATSSFPIIAMLNHDVASRFVPLLPTSSILSLSEASKVSHQPLKDFVEQLSFKITSLPPQGLSINFAARFHQLSELEISYEWKRSGEACAPHFLETVVHSGLHQRLKVLKLTVRHGPFVITTDDALLQAFFSVRWPSLTELRMSDMLMEPLLQLAYENPGSLSTVRVLGDFWSSWAPFTCYYLGEAIDRGVLPSLERVIYAGWAFDSPPSEQVEDIKETYRRAGEPTSLALRLIPGEGEGLHLRPLAALFSNDTLFENLRCLSFSCEQLDLKEMIPMISALGTTGNLPHLEELWLQWWTCMDQTPFPIAVDAGAWPSLRSLQFPSVGLDTNLALLRGLLQAPGPRLQSLEIQDEDGGQETSDIAILAILHMLGTDATISWRSSLTTLTLGYGCPMDVPADKFIALKTAFLALPSLVHLSSWQRLHPVALLAIVDAMAFEGLKKLKKINVGATNANASLLMFHVWRKFGASHQVPRITNTWYQPGVNVDWWMGLQRKLEQQGH